MNLSFIVIVCVCVYIGYLADRKEALTTEGKYYQEEDT